jgi:predicted ribosome quality control (RQC) complex YloA/Tae2 family protein
MDERKAERAIDELRNEVQKLRGRADRQDREISALQGKDHELTGKLATLAGKTQQVLDVIKRAGG